MKQFPLRQRIRKLLMFLAFLTHRDLQKTDPQSALMVDQWV